MSKEGSVLIGVDKHLGKPWCGLSVRSDQHFTYEPAIHPLGMDHMEKLINMLVVSSNHRGMIVGCDSMPAGHAGPATDNPSIVLGSQSYNSGFYCPPDKSLVVMPSKGAFTSSIEPSNVVWAIQELCSMTR